MTAKDTKKRRWWIAAIAVVAAAMVTLIAIPVVGLAQFMITQATGRVTVVTDADGSERTVLWRDYPGVAELEPDDVLAGPSVEDGYEIGHTIIADIQDALGKEFGPGWTEQAEADVFANDVQNWFGGESMLTTINGPTAESTSVPATWADKQRVIAIIGEVTAEYGFAAPILDQQLDAHSSDADRIRDLGGATPETQVIVAGTALGPVGQWLSFVFVDGTKDVDGRFSEEGWNLNTIGLSYGANALLPEADREEFERRLEPFLGLTPPPPLET